MKQLSDKHIRDFQRKIHTYYKENKRMFPWRRTRSPYRVFISEIMLQQTQADRVVDYYGRFIKRFPTVQKLARASFKSVLKEWQGLGYNRRVKFIHEAAKKVISEHSGKFPKTLEALQTLPGVGPNTAASISSFAYNQPVVFIETNIRSVFIHEFFPGRKSVDDKVLLPLIEQTLDTHSPRDWYNALMDYGTMLKRTHPNPSRGSKHHSIQKPFKGSNREIRGAIMRLLTNKGKISLSEANKSLSFEKEAIARNMDKLVIEGMIKRKGNTYYI